jgi:EamA domain-containing membrane protein RarD
MILIVGEALEGVKKGHESGIKLNIGFIIVSIFLILLAVFVIKDELAKIAIYAIFGFIIFVAVLCLISNISDIKDLNEKIKKKKNTQ